MDKRGLALIFLLLASFFISVSFAASEYETTPISKIPEAEADSGSGSDARSRCLALISDPELQSYCCTSGMNYGANDPDRCYNSADVSAEPSSIWADFTGTTNWGIQVTDDESGCGGDVSTSKETVSISIDKGTFAETSIHGQPVDGSLEGSKLSINSITFPDSGGETTIRGAVIDFGSDCSSLSSEYLWDWESASQSCSGSTKLSGTRTDSGKGKCPTPSASASASGSTTSKPSTTTATSGQADQSSLNGLSLDFDSLERQAIKLSAQKTSLDDGLAQALSKGLSEAEVQKMKESIKSYRSELSNINKDDAVSVGFDGSSVQKMILKSSQNLGSAVVELSDVDLTKSPMLLSNKYLISDPDYPVPEIPQVPSNYEPLNLLALKAAQAKAADADLEAKLAKSAMSDPLFYGIYAQYQIQKSSDNAAVDFGNANLLHFDYAKNEWVKIPTDLFGSCELQLRSCTYVSGPAGGKSYYVIALEKDDGKSPFTIILLAAVAIAAVAGYYFTKIRKKSRLSSALSSS